MKIRILMAVLAFVMSALAVKAQTPTNNIAPAHLKAAENMLASMGIENNLPKLRQNLISAFANSIPVANREKFISAMGSFMNQYYTWDALKVKMSQLYATNFSIDELKELTRFYSSPIGKKVIDKMPEMQKQGMEMGQALVLEHMDELEKIMQEQK